MKNQTNLSNDLGKAPAGATGTPQDSMQAPPASGTPAPTPSVPGASTNGAPIPSPDAPQRQAVDPFGPDAEKGTFTERQTRILQGIGVLQNGNKVFPEAVDEGLAARRRMPATPCVR